MNACIYEQMSFMQEIVDKEQGASQLPVFMAGLSMGGMTSILVALRNQRVWKVYSISLAEHTLDPILMLNKLLKATYFIHFLPAAYCIRVIWHVWVIFLYLTYLAYCLPHVWLRTSALQNDRHDLHSDRESSCFLLLWTVREPSPWKSWQPSRVSLCV